MNSSSSPRRLSKHFWISLIVILLAIPASIYFCYLAGGRAYYLSRLLIILLTLVPFFLAFESRKPQARELVVLAVLCALAVASRAVFYGIPSFKPITGVIMISSIAFGPEAGFLIGAVSGLASNFIFGQGPWTPWQMFAFGMAGFLTGTLARLRLLPRKPLPLAIYGFLTTLIIIGPILDTCSIFLYPSQITQGGVLAIYISGVPFNAVHGLATFLTLLLASKPLLEKLDRIKVKYGMMEGDHAL